MGNGKEHRRVSSQPLSKHTSAGDISSRAILPPGLGCILSTGNGGNVSRKGLLSAKSETRTGRRPKIITEEVTGFRSSFQSGWEERPVSPMASHDSVGGPGFSLSFPLPSQSIKPLT